MSMLVVLALMDLGIALLPDVMAVPSIATGRMQPARRRRFSLRVGPPGFADLPLQPFDEAGHLGRNLAR